ncbi:hypothetical protein AB0K43_10615 [Kitasatospora sp. NPDC049258]
MTSVLVAEDDPTNPTHPIEAPQREFAASTHRRRPAVRGVGAESEPPR